MDTFHLLRAFIATQFGLDERSISRETTLREILCSPDSVDDSLDRVEFILALEERLSVEIPDTVAESFDLDWTLQELADLIDGR